MTPDLNRYFTNFVELICRVYIIVVTDLTKSFFLANYKGHYFPLFPVPRVLESMQVRKDALALHTPVIAPFPFLYSDSPGHIPYVWVVLANQSPKKDAAENRLRTIINFTLFMDFTYIMQNYSKNSFMNFCVKHITVKKFSKFTSFLQ